MKAQRRHELQHNVLADWLGKQLEFVKPYTNWILGGVIAVFAVFIVMQIIVNQRSAKDGAGWSTFYLALSVADSDERAKKLNELESGPAGLWAHLAEADLKLDQATSKFYSDKDAYKTSLAEAKEHYLKVEELSRRQHLLHQRALLGLAQAFETEGDFAKAKEKYEEAKKESPESVFGKTAKRNLERLNTSDLSALYDKLASFKPVSKPRSPGLEGNAGTPGFGQGPGGFGGSRGMPDFGAPLPERPDLSLPGPSLDFPSLDTPEGTNPDAPEKTPEDKEKTPDGEKPDGEKPDPEKKPDPETVPELEKKPDPETVPELEKKPDPKGVPDSESKPDPKDAPDVEKKPDAETESKKPDSEEKPNGSS